MEGDGDHPARVVLVDEAQGAALAADESQGAVEDRLVDELGGHLLGDEGVHARDGVDELRLQMDARGGRLA
ncbi:MAG TPA: hypothetical protein VGF68_19005 [Solirubrobacteraceae bacterium]